MEVSRQHRVRETGACDGAEHLGGDEVEDASHLELSGEGEGEGDGGVEETWREEDDVRTMLPRCHNGER